MIFRYIASYDIDMAAGKEIPEPDDAEVKKLTLYFCSKCPEDKKYKKPYKTANGRNSHEEKKHSYKR